MKIFISLLITINVAFSCLGQHHLSIEMLEEVLRIDSISNSDRIQPYLLVKFTSRDLSVKHTVTTLISLKGAIQIEKKGWQSDQKLREIIKSNYKEGYLFTKRKALEYLPFNYFSNDELRSLENSEAYNTALKNYLEDWSLATKFLRVKDNKDSLAFFLSEHLHFDSNPQIYSVDNPHKFIQLLWTRGIILVEGHNLKLFVHDNDLFVSKFSYLIDKKGGN